jgi:autotransporter-associated beta strand protein
MNARLPALALLALTAVTRADDIWTGTVDGNWNTAGNWLSGTVPPNSQASGNLITIGDPGSTNFTQNHNRASGNSIFGLVINGNASSDVIIGGNALGFGAGGIDLSAAGVDLTFNNIVNINAGGGVWTVPAGRTLTLVDVNNNGGVTTAGAGTIRLTGGAGNDNASFNITVGGTTTLELDKSVAGGVRAIGSALTVNNGALVRITGVGGDQVVQGADVTLNPGGVFDLNGFSEAWDGLSGGGTVQNSSANPVVLTVADDTTGGTFTGFITESSGPISLTKGEAFAGGSGGSTFILAPSAAGNLTYTGPTTLNEGHLRLNANALTAISSNSRIVLNAGTLENDATFSTLALPLGTGTGQFSFGTGSANFAANGAPLTVDLGSNAQLTWGGNFVPNNQTFGFGSNFGSAAFTTTLTNPVDLGGTPGATNGSLRTLTGSGGSAGFEGELSGVISGAAGLRKDNINAIDLSNTGNTYEGGTFVTGGALGFSAPGGIAAAGIRGLEAYLVPTPLTAATPTHNNPSVSYSGAGAATAAFFSAIADNNFAGTVSLNSNGVAHDFSLAPAGIRDELYLGVPAGNNFAPGPLTPANATYRLGGGNGQLNLNAANLLTGANALVVRDGGVVSMTADQNFTGTITVNGGAFQIRNAGTELSGSADIVVNGIGTHGHLSTGNLINGYSGGSATIYSNLKGGALLLQDMNDASGAWAASRTVLLNGGAISGHLSAANSVIQVPSVSLNSGYSMIAAQPQFSGTGYVQVGNLVRANPGATVEFRSQFSTLGGAGDTGKIRLTNVDGSPVANVNGILGGWALASNGNSTQPNRFAEWDAAAGVRQFTNYGATTAPGSWSGGSLGTENWLVNAASTLTADTTVNSLVVERNLNLNNNVDLVVNSGGVMLAGTSTGSAYGLANGSNLGSLTSAYNSGLPGAPNELLIYAANQGGDTRITGVSLTDHGGDAVQVIKGGPGQIIHHGNSSFTGGLVINQGTWQADFRSSRTPLTAGNGEITVRSGGILSIGLDNGSPQSISNTINLDGGVLRNSNTGGGTGATVTFTGTLNITSLPNDAAYLDARDNRPITFGPTAVWTGSGNLSRINSGGTAATVDIQTANTFGFTGNLILNAGTTQVSGAGVFPNVDVYLNGGTLGVTTTTASTLRSLAGIGGTVTGGGGSSLTIDQSIDTAFHGNVTGTQLIKTGAGHLFLGGATDNSAAKVIAQAGTITLGKASDRSVHAVGSAGLDVTGGTAVLGGSYATSGSGLGAPPTFLNAAGATVNLETQPGYTDQIYDNGQVTISSGVLDLNGRTEMINQLNGSGGQIRNDGASPSTLVVGRNNGSGSYAGALNDGAAPLNLVKAGSGTQTLTGSGNFTGKTTVAAGTLSIASGNEASLGANPGAWTYDQLTLSGGTLLVTGADLSLNDPNRGVALSANSGTFNIDTGRVMNLDNVLSGAPGTLHKAGAGTFNLTANAQVAALVTSAGVYNQVGGTTQVLTTGGVSVGNSATYALAGGTLRTDFVTVAAGGTFTWGAELTVRQSNSGVPTGPDFTLAVAPTGPDVRTGTVLTGTGDLATAGGATLTLGGLYFSGGVVTDRMQVAGGVDLTGANALNWGDSTVYLLRPFGFFTEDYGSIPLLAAASITGTFTSFNGLTDDGKGFTQLADVVGGPLIDPATLNLNEGVLQYAYGVVDPLGFAAGTYDLLYFHYKVAGSVPEPDTFALLALSVLGLRTARTLRQRRARVTG